MQTSFHWLPPYIMSNNNILRRLRFTFDFSDSDMMELFALGGMEASRAQISSWLKKEDDDDFQGIIDKQLATFLNGFIIKRRGKKDDTIPKAEKSLSNNLIFRKLRIALNLKEDDLLDIFELAEFRISKHEISAFFRKPTQSQYRLCKDQVLRNFLFGLQLKYGPTPESQA